MTSEESLEIETVASVAATTDSKPGEETIAYNLSPLHHLAELRHDPDAIRHLFESGEYPYKRKISQRDYEKHKVELQIELLKVQDWFKATGQKVVILFEGRDAAGKGGTIKTLYRTPKSEKRACHRAGKADGKRTQTMVFSALYCGTARRRRNGCV